MLGEKHALVECVKRPCLSTSVPNSVSKSWDFIFKIYPWTRGIFEIFLLYGRETSWNLSV